MRLAVAACLSRYLEAVRTLQVAGPLGLVPDDLCLDQQRSAVEVGLNVAAASGCRTLHGRCSSERACIRANWRKPSKPAPGADKRGAGGRRSPAQPGLGHSLGASRVAYGSGYWGFEFRRMRKIASKQAKTGLFPARSIWI